MAHGFIADNHVTAFVVSNLVNIGSADSSLISDVWNMLNIPNLFLPTHLRFVDLFRKSIPRL
ncbi:ArsB/NhaD family transporter [Lentibacillus sp. CBA3610]|uniref:ArsB/NhaD family transporter n=1 Tax=Lentibacillus sp. CBA3610 TaxID=2518176 RepID=UPI0020D23500|nr:ArsB/NhaD family transporter [Lentibacillus sp. CBA3610]